MQRISTTVVAVVGEQARACAKGLEGAANIRVELPDPAAPPLERAAAAWQATTSTQAPPPSGWSRSTPPATRSAPASASSPAAAGGPTWTGS